MNRDEAGLLAWQWSDYATRHKNRTNLILHILTVPVFFAGLLTLVVSLAHFAWSGVAVGIVAMIFVVAAQGRTHKLEELEPAPFRGPLDVVARLFVEQLVTFPRFVLSGGWSRAMQESAPDR